MIEFFDFPFAAEENIPVFFCVTVEKLEWGFHGMNIRFSYTERNIGTQRCTEEFQK